ncbi:MAG TPA: cytochrome P450 [Solirubrobacteraceae bacterium]|nr:cytochrome P450 [Solirubrobacteraceae bacterium]
MSSLVADAAAPIAPKAELRERTAPASPAGPVDATTPIRVPAGPRAPMSVQTARFVRDPMGSTLSSFGQFGDVWELKLASRPEPFVVTTHPDHVKSLMTANPADAPSLTGESPLRPILGPNSVLTLIGERHMRQRKLLLPPFHGDAVARYVEMIERVVDQELSTWQTGQTLRLAERMQAVTLEVIMSGVFGIEPGGAGRSSGRRLRVLVSRLMKGSSTIFWRLAELQNIRRVEPRGTMKFFLDMLDTRMYAVIAERRALGVIPGRHDVLSLLLEARDEDGRPLTDHELRDELLTLLLAGHETTANSLAWTFERLLRTPATYDRLRAVVRDADDDAGAYIEATINEGMRVRPVIPFVVRQVKRPWRFGEYVVPADTPIAMSIIALHHRSDVYPDPHRFEPDRYMNVKPGTYTWIPFGGGIRRCLGATLAMAEQRVVVRALAERVDLTAPSSEPERPRQRNVTMIPAKGGLVTVQRMLT